MDKLFEAATFYKDYLLNRQFYIKAGKKGQILEFNIIFSAKEFKHLAGLHKLKDLPEVQKNKSEILLRQVLKKRIYIRKYFAKPNFARNRHAFGQFL